MQKLQLSIPEPCHENWQHMTPTEQGRFCNACAKEVVDFSTMTDIQVLNYFTNLTNEKVCGRALPEQLDRTISRPEPKKKKLFWYWNYIVMFFMFFTKANTVKAQGGIKATCSKTISASDLDKIKQTDINNALAGKVGGLMVVSNRIITGKVIEENGNPVPFALIKIKGTPTGTSADANGAYSIRVRPNAILEINSVGFKSVEIATGSQSVFTTVLEKSKAILEGAIVIVKKIDSDAYNGPLDKSKRVAVIQVKDEATGKVIPNASVIVKPDYVDKVDTVFTNKKGIHKIKAIKEDDAYEVRISANGYESREFTIDENDFKDRKKEWQVLLKKKPYEFRSTSNAKLGKETPIRLGGVHAVNLDTKPLYVVDGTIVSNVDSVKPEDIEDVSILQGPAATALFGTDGANGAIVVTTRKAKEIKMKEVVVTSEFGTRNVTMGAMISGVTITIQNSVLKEKMTTLKTVLTDSIKIYPNPVQRNNEFSVQLKLKQPRSIYQMNITDAAGKVLLQKQMNVASKDHTEKIMAGHLWAAGIYYISIIDNKNRLISRKSFIFE